MKNLNSIRTRALALMKPLALPALFLMPILLCGPAMAAEFREWDSFRDLHVTPEGAVADHRAEGDVITS